MSTRAVKFIKFDMLFVLFSGLLNWSDLVAGIAIFARDRYLGDEAQYFGLSSNNWASHSLPSYLGSIS